MTVTYFRKYFRTSVLSRKYESTSVVQLRVCSEGYLEQFLSHEVVCEDTTSSGGNVELGTARFPQSIQRPAGPILKGVRDGNQLEVLVGIHQLSCRARSSATGSDQGHFDRIIAGRVCHSWVQRPAGRLG